PGIRCSSSRRCGPASQCQAPFAGTVGHRGDAAVVPVATTVEDDRGGARLLGALCDEPADLLGLLGLVALHRPHVGLHGRGRGDGLADGVVDDLDEDVPGAAGDDQPRTARGPRDLLADAQVATTTSGALALGSLDDHCHGLLTSLSDLATDLLALVAHALALVRVGTAQLADVGGDLTDELLVDPLDREAGRVLDGEGDALRRLDDDGVAEPERELEVAALVLDAVTGAVDLELLLVPSGDTDDHVVDEAAAQAVQRAGLPLVVRARDLDALVGPGDRDGLGHDGLQLTL